MVLKQVRALPKETRVIRGGGGTIGWQAGFFFSDTKHSIFIFAATVGTKKDVHYIQCHLWKAQEDAYKQARKIV